MKKIPLPTPGEILLEEFMKPKDLTIYRVAKDSGIPQPALREKREHELKKRNRVNQTQPAKPAATQRSV
jgi:hypothetical protein